MSTGFHPQELQKQKIPTGLATVPPVEIPRFAPACRTTWPPAAAVLGDPAPLAAFGPGVFQKLTQKHRTTVNFMGC